jgi:hypothetical protein
MKIELINPNSIVKCVIGDVLKPSRWWKTKYACIRRTPWFLRIFGIYKDKYEWVIYQGIYEEPYRQHWLFHNLYYSSRDEFNKEHEDYYCDENWIVSRKAFVKLFLADGTRILKCFSDNTERDVWLSSIVGEVPLIKIDVNDE